MHRTHGTVGRICMSTLIIIIEQAAKKSFLSLPGQLHLSPTGGSTQQTESAHTTCMYCAEGEPAGPSS